MKLPEDPLRILVAGAAGFIGSHLCDRLLEEGHEVLGVDNYLTGSPNNVSHLESHPRFRLIRHDVTEPLSVDGPLDTIFNLASPASPKDYLEHPIETLRTGAEGSRHLLDLACSRRARYLLASTSECYGDPQEHPQKETYWGHVNPVGPRSCYDEAKRFAEAITMAYHRQHGLSTHIARIFNTYGPRMQLDDGRIVPNFVRQALRGEPLTVYGDGSQTRSFCYVDDLVEGLLLLSRSREHMPVNLGNPEEMTVLEFARRIRDLAGSRSEIRFEPLPEDDPQRRRPDITKARRLLGWEPRVGLEEGLRRTIAWFARRLAGA
jgi:dTDP-glucose 4,6-dehydratase